MLHSTRHCCPSYGVSFGWGRVLVPPPLCAWVRNQNSVFLLQILMTPPNFQPPGVQLFPFYYQHQHLPSATICSSALVAEVPALHWAPSPAVSFLPGGILCPISVQNQSACPLHPLKRPKHGGRVVHPGRNVHGGEGGCAAKHKPQTLRTPEVHPCGIPSPGSC